MAEELHNRRDPRVDVALDIVLQLPSGTQRHRTRNISYRGVFINCDEPLPLRKLLRFQIAPPSVEEAMQMLGLVAHRVNRADAAERGLRPGMGLQLYGLGQDVREQWRLLVREEYERDPYARRMMELRELPHVRVRVPQVELLRHFASNDLRSGQTFLRTGELQPQGARVLLELIHPENQELFHLEAQVGRVVEAPLQSRGMQLHFPPVDQALHDRLETFLRGDVP